MFYSFGRMIPLPTNKFCQNRYDSKKYQHYQYRSRYCVLNESDHANEKHTCIDHTMCYHGHPVISFHLFHLHSPSLPSDIFIPYIPYIVIHDGISVNKPHENAVRFSMKTGLHFLSFIYYLPAGQLPAPSLYLENIQYLFQLVR